MRFKTLIVAILALNIGPHALPALAGSASKIGSSTNVTQTRSHTLEMPSGLSLPEETQWQQVATAMRENAGGLDQAITTARQYRDEMNAVQRLEAREQFAKLRADNDARLLAASTHEVDAGAVAKQWKEERKRTGK